MWLEAAWALGVRHFAMGLDLGSVLMADSANRDGAVGRIAALGCLGAGSRAGCAVCSPAKRTLDAVERHIRSGMAVGAAFGHLQP